MKQEDIQTKLDTITENLEKLLKLSKLSYEEFISDFRNIDSALHILQTSVQALIDTAAYIVSSLGLRIPTSSTEIIDILREEGMIDEYQHKKYIKMVRFRNRVVHLYNKIDRQILYQILTKELDDIKEFYGLLLDIIEKHPD